MENNSVKPILKDEGLELCLTSPYLSEEEKREAFDLARAVAQNSHDHYVALQRVGRLQEEDYGEYLLALEREANGDVIPLEPGKEIKIVERLDWAKAHPEAQFNQ